MTSVESILGKYDLSNSANRHLNQVANEVKSVYENDLKRYSEVIENYKKEFEATEKKQIDDYEEQINNLIKQFEDDEKKELESYKKEIKKNRSTAATKKREDLQKRKVEEDETLRDMDQENLHRREINGLLRKVKTGDNCDSNAVDELEEEHIQNINDDVADEFDDSVIAGGSIRDDVYMINRRFIMHNQDEIPSIRKNKKMKTKRKKIKDSKEPRLVGGASGMAGLVKESIELIHELYGPEIKQAFKNLGNQIQDAFNKAGENWWCNTHPRECREKQREARQKQRQYEFEMAQLEKARKAAEFKKELAEAYQQLFEKETGVLDKKWEDIQEKLGNETKEAIKALDKKWEDAQIDLPKKTDENRDILDKEEQSRFEEQDKKDKEDEIKQKAEFDAAVIKNAEARMQKSASEEQATKGLKNYKNCGASVNSAEKNRHDAFLEEKKKRDEIEEAKAKDEENKALYEVDAEDRAKSGTQAEGAFANAEKEGWGKKEKRTEVVKKIMKKKGLSMIEASKYVKSHNLY